MSRARSFFAVLGVVLAGGGLAFAEGELDLAAMARQLRHNQEELQQYTWQSTVTYLVNGEQRRQDVYTVRYDDQGRREKMQVSSSVAKGTIRGADGKKLKKDEREAARDFALKVRNQLFGYLSPMFAEQAVLTAQATRGDGDLLLTSRDVMTSGDRVEISIDTTTARPKSAAISGSVAGSPVSLEVQFGFEEYGPSYPVHSVTRSTWQGLELTIITDDEGHSPR